MKRKIPASLAAAAVLCAAAHDVRAQNALLDAQPAGLQGLMNATYAEGEWAAVLNYNRLAVAAIEQGRADIAVDALDQSIARIESVYADDPTAKKARGLWSAEGIKDFKGESYERAMTYYYRGLLYMAQGDYQNARASFRSGEYQDTVAEKEEYAGDFGMLHLLAGWASHCDGDDAMAADFYDKAGAQQPGILRPAPGANTLVLVETGLSPIKSTAGQYQEALVISAGGGAGSTIVVGGAPAVVVGDIAFQAMTRGGRQVDKVLAGKASFKGTTETVGNVATAAGMGLMQASTYANSLDSMRNMAGVGALAGLFGMVTKATSAAMTPKADSRYWDTIPDKVHALFLAADTLPQVSVDGVAVDPVLHAKSGACRLGLVRAGTNSAPPASAPGNTTAAERKDIFRRNGDRDLRFRQAFTELLQAHPQAQASADPQEM
ncbi:hypothetical protein [Solimonas soli]|uniref:hypothetical protein n=1 Tax=Solimonas soli TaxID=413479 RepID=UPI0004B9BF55|nr:hypothetical protein [Solimonas soli]